MDVWASDDQRTSRTALVLDRLLWRDVRAGRVSVPLAVVIAYEIADALPVGAFVTTGSNATN